MHDLTKGSIARNLLRTSTFMLVVPAYLMSSAAGFALHWIWYLSVACVAFHMLLNILFLRREYRRKLAFADVAAAEPLAAAQ